jgi:hypothetical protein
MPFVEIANRKKLELEQKMHALEAEFQIWYEKSEKTDGKFAKHHTQIRAIRAMLEPRHNEIRNELNTYSPQNNTNEFLGTCANNEKLILSEHRIWNYFRNKFIQRNEDTFDTYLKAADEFAWECYRPIQETVYPDPATASRKEPPLVFFNGGASPFSVSRDRSFEPEAVVGGGITLDPETVGKLPIPVIGIPWHQVNHLPEILVIGHEVGHIIQNDFNLTGELENCLTEALKNQPEERAAAWKSWLGEIFADLYGCLAAGPAFAGTLIDFLINDTKAIYREMRKAPDWGKYPTIYLRVQLVLHALELLYPLANLNNYKEIWKNYQSQMPAEFLEDIKIVVPALLDAKFQNLRGKSVKEIFQFSKTMQNDLSNTLSIFNFITNENSQVPIPTQNVRTIFAALRTAFEKNPDVYIKNKYSQCVLNFIEKNVLKPGLRSGERTLSNNDINSKIEAYSQAGAELLKFN